MKVVATINKIICKECGWHGMENQTLIAQNPFAPEEAIYGCPNCKSIDSMDGVCQSRKYWQIATCGTPTKNGYKHLCRKHFSKQIKG